MGKICGKALLVRGCILSRPGSFFPKLRDRGTPTPFPSKISCSLPALIWIMSLGLQLPEPYLKAVWQACLSLGLPLTQFPARSLPCSTQTCARNFAIGPCSLVHSLMIGLCHLRQIRVCPQAPQSYILPILWNKAEQIHQSCLSEGCLHLPTAAQTLLPASPPAPSTLMNQCTSNLEEEAEPQNSMHFLMP